MTENKNYTNVPLEEDELEIDLMEYVRKLWNARMLLVKVAGIAAVIGIVIGISIPKKYTAEVILSPESRKGGSNLSGMAAMLGIGNISMGGDANALNFSMASDIVASTPFILELIDTRVQTLDGEMDTTLVAYLGTQSVPWWNTLMSLPSKAIGGVMSLFSSNEETTEKKPIDPFRLTPQQKGQIGAIQSIINIEPDKKSGMTKLSVTVQDPLVAATMADTVLVKLQKYITKYKTSKAEEDLKYWEQLYKERQDEYYKAQEKYAKYSDANQGVILQSVRIEQERLQNEQSLAFQVFTQVATQLQMSRAKLQEEKPAFAILEPASVPLLPTGTSKIIIVLGLAFLAVAVTSAWVLFGKDLWLSLKEGLKEQKEEE
mgnify:CR=1 FL=1